MIPVEVIAIFSEKGEIEPIKIRLKEGEEKFAVKLEACLELPDTHEMRGIKRFKCRFILHDTIKNAELFFYIMDRKWLIAMK